MTTSSRVAAAAATLLLATIASSPLTGCATRAASPALADAARVARWNVDLDVVRDRFLVLDRSHAPAARAAAQARLAALRMRLPTTTDAQAMAELARIAALAGNAHTRVYLLRNRGVWRRYPLRVWPFADGWRVVAARAGAEPLLGGRVVAIGGVPVETLAAALRPLFAGNDSWAAYMATYTLTSPEALSEALPRGAFGAGGEVAFTVERDDGRAATLAVAPLPHVPRDVPEESWWFLSPVHPAVEGWRQVLAAPGAADAAAAALAPRAATPLPVSLARAATWYDARRCDGDVVVVPFHRAGDMPGREPIAAWGARLLADLRARPPRRLLLDLRFNTGGDLTKAQPFVEAIAALPFASDAGAVVVLSDIATFSAGLTPLAWLRGHGHARIVGRHPGDDAVFWAEGGNVVLPNAGIAMHYADGLHVYAADATVPPDVTPYLAFDAGVRTLAPDVAVGWRWADYRAGRDTVADVALGQPLRCPAAG